jgi:Domain of unknown function (DUF4282)
MDFGFHKVYTRGIIKFGYFMSVPGLLLAWLIIAVVGFQFGTLAGLAALFIVGPVVFVSGLLTIRVVFELVLLAVRAADDLQAMRTTGSSMPPA